MVLKFQKNMIIFMKLMMMRMPTDIQVMINNNEIGSSF